MRNHLPVPDINAESYELNIEIEGTETSKTLTLNDVKALPKYDVTAAIMCGGNRRSEMTKVKPVKGLSWGPAAVGNAVWSGARLCDILNAMGIKSDENRHVHVSILMISKINSIKLISFPFQFLFKVRRLRYGSNINTLCSIDSIGQSDGSSW